MSRFKAYRTVSNRYHPTLKVCNGGVRDLEVEQVDIISHKITLKNALYFAGELFAHDNGVTSKCIFLFQPSWWSKSIFEGCFARSWSWVCNPQKRSICHRLGYLCIPPASIPQKFELRKCLKTSEFCPTLQLVMGTHGAQGQGSNMLISQGHR